VDGQEVGRHRLGRQGPGARDAGVVHQHVEPPGRGQDGVDGGCDGGVVGHVEGHRVDLGAVDPTPDLGDGLLEPRGVTGPEVDGPAEGGEASDGLESETLVGPRDEGNG
jgi:hypothetical protein